MFSARAGAKLVVPAFVFFVLLAASGRAAAQATVCGGCMRHVTARNGAARASHS
jgi:hypothetical protein